MRVGIDHDLDAGVARSARVDVAEIAPVDVAVDLDERLRAGGRLEQRFHIQFVAVAPADEPPGRMAQTVDQRMLDGRDHPLGHLR